mmetsp:Transcript_21789/g.60390  ORF Transcript_21789/g.60390 Transcript_21789/m.60390 type:complete len:108 (-) Transcript_21789:601-924(-)|eukprot:458237-Pelagomonas_calceolata.AAC.20
MTHFRVPADCAVLEHARASKHKCLAQAHNRADRISIQLPFQGCCCARIEQGQLQAQAQQASKHGWLGVIAYMDSFSVPAPRMLSWKRGVSSIFKAARSHESTRHTQG